VVLVLGDPEVVTPENLALALTTECQSCLAFASAFQLVLGTGEMVRVTAEGQQRLAEVHRQLLALRDADLPPEELQARVDALAAEVRAIVATELVVVGPPDQGEPGAGTTTTTTTTRSPADGDTTTTTTTADGAEDDGDSPSTTDGSGGGGSSTTTTTTAGTGAG
jgi:hypothetical protein